ncbi:MAG: hypothetical protein ACREK9_13915 [Candidatus Rokuibacteriota bacterium]
MDREGSPAEKGLGGFSRPAKHQLVIHVDYGPPPAGLQVRYSYPFNAFQVSPERILRIPEDQILRDVLRYLDLLHKGLTDRIPIPTPVRRPAAATIVIQDESHRLELPLAWLTYEEEGPTTGSRAERQVRMSPRDFTADELSSWDRLRQRIKGIAWTHYQGVVGEDLVR